MSKITVTKNGYVVSVYYNNNATIGLEIAKMTHGKSCKYRVDFISDSDCYADYN